MFVCPIASMTVASALPMRVFRLSNAVPMPPVAAFAWSLKDFTEPVPFASSSTRASLNFWMWLVGIAPLTPTPRYSPRSRAEWPAPRTAVASCFIWPGAVSMSEFQSSPSALPLDRICENWYMAPCAAAVPLPPASITSLNARAILVASPRLPPVDAICWVNDASASVEDGRPSRWSLIALMDLSAVFAEYPSDCMTVGKLFSVSTRATAVPIEPEIASIAFDTTLAAAPATAPAFANLPPNAALASSPSFPAAPVPTPANARETSALSPVILGDTVR